MSAITDIQNNTQGTFFNFQGPYQFGNVADGLCMTQNQCDTFPDQAQACWGPYTSHTGPGFWANSTCYDKSPNPWKQFYVGSDGSITTGVNYPNLGKVSHLVTDNKGNTGIDLNPSNDAQSTFSINGVNNSLTGTNAILYGPFRITSSYGSLRGNNEIATWPATNDADRGQMWIDMRLANICNGLNIHDWAQCNQDNICQTALNNGDISAVPWCNAYARNSPSVTMDPFVSTYCSKNKGDTDFCGCINETAEFTTLKNELAALPDPAVLTLYCNSTNCKGNPNAYHPSDFASTNCQPQQVCIQNVSVGEAEISKMENVSLSCRQSSETKNSVKTETTSTVNNTTSIGGGTTGGSGGGTSEGEETTKKSSSSKSSSSSSSFTLNSTTSLYIVAGIGIFLFLAFFWYMIGQRK